jgi:hypothetical protein
MVMKRASLSCDIANHFNLELDAYLQTVDWLQGSNNGEVLFIMGMGDICTGHPGGATLLTRAEEECDLQTAYVLSVIYFYKHGATEDVFIHIQRVYGEVTSGSQVGGWWWMEDGAYDEDDARVARVRNRVSAEISHVMWREHINHYHIIELHMPNDGHQCLWKWGCVQLCTPVFCNLRCRIR